jgi:hypothetical protein
MSKQQLVKPPKNKNKAQSLVELTLVLGILLTLLVGMVEFGNLLNQYINLVDGAREGARFGATDDPFEVHLDSSNNIVENYEPFFTKIYQTVQGAILPLVLTKENGDDVVVTFFSVTGDKTLGLQHMEPFVSDPANAPSGCASYFCNHTSKFGNNNYAQVETMVSTLAPSTGVLLVEVFYNYHSITGLFSFLKWQDDQGKLTNTILVHTYAVMPLSAAEPTPTTPP